MKGRYKVRVKNSRNSYEFELKRNVTILRGLSGKGKTTLYDMIREHNRFGKESGVSVSCDRNLFALEGDNWESDIETHPGEIIVIDEDSRFINSKAFAEAVRGSDNYFLIITRNYLPNLPISVNEIYELVGGKNKQTRNVYQETDLMYDRPNRQYLPFVPEVIVTEDSGAGFQFFKHEAEKLGIQCISAGGKTKIYSVIKDFTDKAVVVIADGAAFGAEIDDLVKQQILRPRKLAIFLPESFEWLILASGLISIHVDKLEFTEEYADSKDYLSWEQYFTQQLIEATKDVKHMRYSKKKLSDFYLQDRNSAKIKQVISGIKL